MQKLDIALEIQSVLKNKFNIDSLIKGSCGYGVPSEVSDIDIQLKLDNLAKLQLLKSYFNAKEFDPVKIIDNDGNEFTSYMLVFEYSDIEISLLYDDNDNVYELVKTTLETITNLPLDQKYILRLIGGSYKYMSTNAYKVLLDIFNKVAPILKDGLVEDIKHGKLINKDDAQIIRKMVQALFVNETNCKYPRKFLN